MVILPRGVEKRAEVKEWLLGTLNQTQRTQVVFATLLVVNSVDFTESIAFAVTPQEADLVIRDMITQVAAQGEKANEKAQRCFRKAFDEEGQIRSSEALSGFREWNGISEAISDVKRELQMLSAKLFRYPL